MLLRLTPDIDWAKFLQRHDLVYKRLPGRWDEGAFLGNGLLGAMAYNRPDGGENPAALRFDVGRGDVAERQPRGWWRLPVGHLTLSPQGRRIVGFDGRLSLWDAAFSGTLTTDEGALSLRAFVCADRHVLVVEATPRGGEAATFEWHAAVSANPRSLFKTGVEAMANPEPFTEALPDGVTVCAQPMEAGGGYATAWAVVPGKAGAAATLFLSVGFSRDGDGGRGEAVAAVREAAQAGADALRRAHEKWWHGYLPQSFLSVPDARLESFYWLQMYKLGAATRQGGPLLDLMGPWYKDTPWPGVWWNLNVQLTYWPAYGANRLEQAATLVDHIDAHADAFTANAPEPWRDDSAMVGRTTGYDCLSIRGPGATGGEQEAGNLTWALHNYWLHCRHAGDDARLRDRLFPLLGRAVNLYLHLLEEGDDRLHLPPTLSPEFGVAPDANYDLALLRWGCATLLDLSARFGLADPREPEWREVLERLTDHPVEWERGYHVGRGVPLDRSHRHASHLMMVYPLRLVSPERREERALIERSLDHWLSLRDAHQGYTYVLGASMCALLGRREQAVRLLNEFVERYLKPNTMYLESGPVIETPLAGANTLQELLLRSDPGGIVRVFPCVPEAWRDACFHDLRAEGAFLVSAKRAAGRTVWVRVKSLAGEPCRVRTDLPGPVESVSAVGRRTPLSPDADGAYPLTLKAGETAILVTRGTQPDRKVAPVPALPGTVANYFGAR